MDEERRKKSQQFKEDTKYDYSGGQDEGHSTLNHRAAQEITRIINKKVEGQPSIGQNYNKGGILGGAKYFGGKAVTERSAY